MKLINRLGLTVSLLFIFHFLYAGTGVFPLSAEFIRKEKLADVQSLDPSIKVSLAYAATNNFLGKNVYGDVKICYLRMEAAVKLTNAQRLLKTQYPGFSLLIYDGLRPRRVQFQMWEIVKDTVKQQYVANPKGGSIHNYGAAVDLTVAGGNGEPLDMGTPFDYFGTKAQPKYEEYFLHPEKVKGAEIDGYIKKLIDDDLKAAGPLTPAQVNNRLILRRIMLEAGFQAIPNEWWHFEAFPKDVVRKKYGIVE
jgi:zinc D-Ala-D-Ala dipeptidase